MIQVKVLNQGKKKMNISINNIGTDTFVGNRHIIGVNAIDVSIDGKKLELPLIVPNKIELKYSKIAKNYFRMPLFQMVHRAYNIKEIRCLKKAADISDDYEKLILDYKQAIGDFYLQIPQDNHLLQVDREIIHEIQVNAGARILSDYELNRSQSINDFENQILQLRQEYSNFIISPTLDIGIPDEGLFAKKVDKILEHGFDRFNVIFRSIPENITNWIDLSTKIYGKNIWCNVVGATPRWHGKTRIGQISRAFLFGVHTVSMGYPWRGSLNMPAYNFDAATHCFELAPNRITYEQSRSDSILIQRNQNTIARRNIIAKKFFSNYVSNRKGLQQSLVAIT